MSVEIEKEPYEIPTVEELRKGGMKAFGDLYEALSPNLTQYGELFVRDEGRDLVNDVFIRLGHKLPTLELKEGADLRSYLFVSVRNAAVSQLRKTRNSEVGLEALEDREDSSDVEKTVGDIIFIGALFEEARNLPPRQREALLLRAGEFTEREIAGKMGISQGAVKSHISRGRERLKAKINYP